MAETLQSSGLWHVVSASNDLIEQAGLDADDIEPDLGFFRYKKREVIISHIYDQHLVVSIQGKEDNDARTLMDAFSAIVEYKPFCKYTLKLEDAPPLLTYEWDKQSPDERYKELTEKDNIENLVKITS
ncbi:hypothetical protein GOV06_00935 [Candidatus Woesearchaeota archaeon]|nr:hypothetical protein [Candidatus Woesearchaeota archaeon]